MTNAICIAVYNNEPFATAVVDAMRADYAGRTFAISQDDGLYSVDFVPLLGERVGFDFHGALMMRVAEHAERLAQQWATRAA